MTIELNRRQFFSGAVAASALLLGGFGLHGALPCDIYGELGDSNTYSGMLATGTAGYDPAIDVTNFRCLEFRNQFQNTGKSTTVIAQDQFGYSSSGVGCGGCPPVGSIGSGLTFMRDGMLPNLAVGRNLMYCVYGVGGTASAGWTSGGAAPSIITRLQAAVALNPLNVLKAVKITLGTNDAITNVTGAAFTTNIVTIVNLIRAAFPAVPILFTGLVDGWSSGTSAQIAAAIAALPASISQSAVVDTTGCTGQTSGGVIFHFTAASLRTMGGVAAPLALANLSP